MSWWTVAQDDPDRLAIIDGDRQLTFGEFHAIVNQIAASWSDLGVADGGTVAVVLPNCWQLLAIQQAAYSTGRYLVPINRHLTAPEIAYIFGNCQPSVVVTCDRLIATVDYPTQESGVPAADRVFTIDAGERSFENVWSSRPDEDPESRVAGAVMFYSSGTTGRPKGIRRELTGVSPEAALEPAKQLWSLLNLGPGPGVHVAVAPLYHSAPNAMANGALHRGVTVAISPGDRFEASTFLSFIGKIGMTETFMVPTMFVRLLRLPDDERAAYDPSPLRSVVHAGAPCPIPVKQQLIEWWGPVIEEFYGSTESSAMTTVHSDEWLEAPETVGRAVPGYEVQIRDASGAVAPVGDEGLIYCVGSARFEYAGDPDKTRNSWDDDALILGDVGRLDDAGRLFILDRRTDLILVGGVNVYPAEVEFALLEHPSVEDVAVIGVPDEEYGNRVIAVVAAPGATGRAALEQELSAYAESALARFKRPREYRIVDEVPRSAAGKISRAAIRREHLPT